VYRLAGDEINGIIEALRKRQESVRFIQVRHEEAASLYGLRQTQPASWGRCVATSGPGGIHLLNGLYDAKLDGQPVLAITGLQFHDLLHTHTQQDVALDRVFGDACAYNERCMGPAHMENIAELACLGLSRLSRATFTPR
jgi:pyruvate dehydrogenase (quinone)/pyruvate oxidase